MNSIPQLDIAPRTYRCSPRLPASSRYRVDHVFIPASNQKEVQDFLTNCADSLENSKLETTHHPTMHLINKRRVLKPRYNAGRYATQTQRNDASTRNIQMQIQRQYHQTAKTPLPPVYDEGQIEYSEDINTNINIFQAEYNPNNLISVPQSIRIRMYHRNEMIQNHSNEDEFNDTQANYETIDHDLPIPSYEEDNENVCEEIDEKDIDKAADYTEPIVDQNSNTENQEFNENGNDNQLTQDTDGHLNENENPDANKNVEGSDANENIENPDINKNIENPDANEKIENPDTNENVENLDTNEKVENPDTNENVENPGAHENIDNHDEDVENANTANENENTD